MKDIKNTHNFLAKAKKKEIKKEIGIFDRKCCWVWFWLYLSIKKHKHLKMDIYSVREKEPKKEIKE